MKWALMPYGFTGCECARYEARGLAIGLAAAIASESEQQGWQEPELIGREHRQRFMTLGHPIVAGDVAHAIPEAIADESLWRRS